MSAQLIFSDAQPSKLSVSFRVLLSLYAIIPCCLLLHGLDVFFWQDTLRNALPSNPKQFLLFQILFGTPHIMASSILLLSNKEYLSLYQTKLIRMSVLLALFFGIGSLFISYRTFYVITALWTVFHVLKQQLGVAQGCCRLPSKLFYAWIVFSVGAGSAIYLLIFLKQGLNEGQTLLLQHIAILLCGLLMLTAIYCQRQIKNKLGSYFLWSNVLLVLTSFYFYLQEYSFFAILMPRLVHDFTAYIFYLTHDYNKHHRQAKNSLYRFAQRYHIHTFLVLPILSLAVAFALQQYGDIITDFISAYFLGEPIPKVISVGLLGYLALMHYYTESFTWKGDSPYRCFIRFN